MEITYNYKQSSFCGNHLSEITMIGNFDTTSQVERVHLTEDAVMQRILSAYGPTLKQVMGLRHCKSRK